MAHYIDKDALIAEIDKRLSAFMESFIANMDAPITIIGHQGMWTYTALKDIVDTLEVKEVQEPTASDRCMAEEIIINLKRVESDYHIDLTREMEWLKSKAQKG